VARIDVPEGDGPEALRIWSLRPEMAEGVGRITEAVYWKSALPAREREVARMRIAQINDCPVCLAWRENRLQAEGVSEEMYAEVACFATSAALSEREKLAAEYAERFALDHTRIDDGFFARLRSHFADDEILDLSVCIAEYLGFGRLTQVLRIDQERSP
jgi:AhpD family alkylhydroperoxidase